jgi:hypothetical protein
MAYRVRGQSNTQLNQNAEAMLYSVGAGALRIAGWRSDIVGCHPTFKDEECAFHCGPPLANTLFGTAREVDRGANVPLDNLYQLKLRISKIGEVKATTKRRSTDEEGAVHRRADYRRAEAARSWTQSAATG